MESVIPDVIETTNWVVDKNGEATLKIGSDLSGWTSDGERGTFDWTNGMLCVHLGRSTQFFTLIPIQFQTPATSCSMTVELNEIYWGIVYASCVKQDNKLYMGIGVFPTEDIATGKVLIEYSKADMPKSNDLEMGNYIGIYLNNVEISGSIDIYIKGITLKF